LSNGLNDLAQPYREWSDSGRMQAGFRERLEVLEGDKSRGKPDAFPPLVRLSWNSFGGG